MEAGGVNAGGDGGMKAGGMKIGSMKAGGIKAGEMKGYAPERRAGRIWETGYGEDDDDTWRQRIAGARNKESKGNGIPDDSGGL